VEKRTSQPSSERGASLAHLGHLGLEAEATLRHPDGVWRAFNCLFLTMDGLSFDPNRLKPRKNRLGRHLALIEVPSQVIEVLSQAIEVASQAIELPSQATDVAVQAIGVPPQTIGMLP
jgi:hypothetical protein